MEDIGTLYKVRVGFHDEGDVDWYQSYLQAPTWFIEQVTRILTVTELPKICSSRHFQSLSLCEIVDI